MLLIDDSRSIGSRGNAQAIINGYMKFIESLRKAPGQVLIKTMFLNNIVNLPFQAPGTVAPLSQNYRLTSGTPLFRRSVQALNCILAEAKCLSETGRTVRTITFIVTDGGDSTSGPVSSSDVRKFTDMMFRSGKHIVGACAVNDGVTDFMKVFSEMGIPERWIMVLKNDPSDIEGTLCGMGKMTSHASAGPASFGETSISGFSGISGT